MNPDERAEVSGITGPEIAPQTTPDPLTTKEIKKSTRESNRPSPGDRHAESVDRHIRDITEDRNRLRAANVSLQKERDELKPQYFALQESYRASLASNVFTTAMVGLGGSLISGAGYAGDGWKIVILCFGIATFGWGFILQVSSTWLSVIFRQSRNVQLNQDNRQKDRVSAEAADAMNIDQITKSQ